MTGPATLAAIHAECFTRPRPWSEAEFASLLAGPGVFLLAEPAGFALGRAIAGEAELLTIAVRPGLRRKGAGSRLLAGFLAEAIARGAEAIFLEVAADNAPALALYEQHGFRQTGRRPGYYRDAGGESVDAALLSRGPAGIGRPA